MKFYFDMDNVLTNFDAIIPNNPALNHPSDTLDEAGRAAKKQFWQTVEKTPNFWHDMPMVPGADYMLSVANEHGEIFILSKTPGAKHFSAGQDYVNFVANEKRNWIYKRFNHLFDTKHVIICDSHKGALIHPSINDILIDDRQENIDEWTQCGGSGILFKSATDAIQRIKMHNFILPTK